MMKVAFIGGGKMVSQIVTGLNHSGKDLELGIWMRNNEKKQQFIKQHEIDVIDELSHIRSYDIIMLGVIPSALHAIAQQLKPFIRPHHIIVSMAGGVSLTDVQQMYSHQRVIRIMPNTPVAVNQGVIAISYDEHIEEKSISEFIRLMKNLGMVERIDESLMHIVPAVAASSPVLVYMMIEAMADNAVSAGMDRATAYRLASQMVQGAGKMVSESGLHPGVLKDQVTSPGGSTIQGVKVLEEEGFRNAVSKAMDKITEYN